MYFLLQKDVLLDRRVIILWKRTPNDSSQILTHPFWFLYVIFLNLCFSKSSYHHWWMLLILACKMCFTYCFSLSSSFLCFIYFFFMLFFRSERIETSSIVFFLGLFTFESPKWELFIEKWFYFFELVLCLEFLWLQHRLLSKLWISEDLASVFYY